MNPNLKTKLDHFAHLVRRLTTALRQSRAEVASLRAAAAGPAPSADSIPQPRTQWEQRTERRLDAIEQQLSHQNRLLLIGILTLAGDIILSLTR